MIIFFLDFIIEILVLIIFFVIFIVEYIRIVRKLIMLDFWNLVLRCEIIMTFLFIIAIIFLILVEIGMIRELLLYLLLILLLIHSFQIIDFLDILCLLKGNDWFDDGIK